MDKVSIKKTETSAYKRKEELRYDWNAIPSYKHSNVVSFLSNFRYTVIEYRTYGSKNLRNCQNPDHNFEMKTFAPLYTSLIKIEGGVVCVMHHWITKAGTLEVVVRGQN